jgi:ABC-2 type transport system permease protein
LRNTVAIARREFAAYFVSPIAYVAIAVFLLVMGIVFSLVLTNPAGAEASLRYTFGNLIAALNLMVITPLITMRLLAEETSRGTIELLLTSPLREWEIVLGKFVASLGLYLVMLALTGFHVLFLTLYGNPDWGTMLSSYLGMALAGSALLSLGLLASALTQNQIIAAVTGFGMILVLLLAQFLANITSPPISTALDQIALFQHYFDFLKGMVDSRHILYYLSLTAAGLFLATQVLRSRRWQG